VLVFTRAGAAPARHRALEAAGVGVQAVRTGDDGRLSLRDVQRILWELGIRRMMLEAGPTLLDAYFQAELVDQVAVYSSSVSGGRGPSLAARLAPARLREVERLEIGSDALLNAFL
jgi:riboflavin biosynthesis pyrimidine reductase